MKKIGRFHVLTDIVLQTRFSHIDLAYMTIQGGADTVQLRHKEGLSTRAMIETARQMQAACETAGVTFIVNDRIDVALAADAHGVHLGQDDFPIPLARKILGEEKIIGGSASTMEEARKCLAEGADYIGFGPVFPTTSKNDAGPVGGLQMLSTIVHSIPLPIIAIGGIAAGNLIDVAKTGVYGIAVISAVCCQENPEAATRAIHAILKQAGLGESNE